MSAEFSLAGRRVLVAGHRGMAGSAIVRRLAGEGCQVLTLGRDEVDLRRQSDTEAWLAAHRPDAVFVAAATVGGIVANSTRPAEFLYDNLAIEANLIHGAWRAGVGKLLFLASNCIYPRLAPQPVAEDALLTGPLEPTNEWYAVAKIAGLKMCQAYRRQYGCDFITAIPAGLYGIGDRYDPEHGHVVASLILKFHRAKVEGLPAVPIWGSGTPRREFMYSEDAADAAVFLMKGYSDEAPINFGSGREVTIRELAEAVARVVGFDGRLEFDASKPDGMPRKLLDTGRMAALGWKPTIGFEDGLAAAYAWFLANVA